MTWTPRAAMRRRNSSWPITASGLPIARPRSSPACPGPAGRGNEAARGRHAGGMPEACHVAGGSERAVDRVDLPLTYDLSQVDPDTGVLVGTPYSLPRTQD